MRVAVAALALSISAFYAVRRTHYWVTQELSSLHRTLIDLHSTLPADVRVLLLMPESARRTSIVQHASARLYPRPVYLLPEGAGTLEEARPWISEKRLTWVVSLGGVDFDPARTFARRLDDGR
ncbi:MAG: hypothetical protein ACK44W_00520 [Planctomycetota bacterium]